MASSILSLAQIICRQASLVADNLIKVTSSTFTERFFVNQINDGYLNKQIRNF